MGSGLVGRAVELVRFEPVYDQVFAYVFGDTLVFADLATARQQLGRSRAVTLDGELLARGEAVQADDGLGLALIIEHDLGQFLDGHPERLGDVFDNLSRWTGRAGVAGSVGDGIDGRDGRAPNGEPEGETRIWNVAVGARDSRGGVPSGSAPAPSSPSGRNAALGESEAGFLGVGGKGTARRLAVVHALRRSLGGWRRCEPAVPSLFIFEIATC